MPTSHQVPGPALVALRLPPPNDIADPGDRKGVVDEQAAAPIDAEDLGGSPRCLSVSGGMAQAMIIIEGGNHMGEVGDASSRPCPSRSRLPLWQPLARAVAACA